MWALSAERSDLLKSLALRRVRLLREIQQLVYFFGCKPRHVVGMASERVLVRVSLDGVCSLGGEPDSAYAGAFRPKGQGIDE